MYIIKAISPGTRLQCVGPKPEHEEYLGYSTVRRLTVGFGNEIDHQRPESSMIGCNVSCPRNRSGVTTQPNNFTNKLSWQERLLQGLPCATIHVCGALAQIKSNRYTPKSTNSRKLMDTEEKGALYHNKPQPANKLAYPRNAPVELTTPRNRATPTEICLAMIQRSPRSNTRPFFQP